MREHHSPGGHALRIQAAAIAWATLAVGAHAGSRDLHVAVWGPDGALLEGATVALVTPAGTCKGSALPDGCQLVANDARKGRLVVAHDLLGSGERELHLPAQDPVEIDVLYIAPGQVEFHFDVVVPKHMRTGGFNGRGPENDLCADAIPLTIDVTTLGTTIGATVDDDLPECGAFVSSPGVWYSVEGTGAEMRASTCDAMVGYDTKLSVYCGTCEVPVCVGGNDDACGDEGLRSEVSWCSQLGQTYWILVHGFGGATGDFGVVANTGNAPCMGAVACTPTGACCFLNADCLDDQTLESCYQLGGAFMGEGTKCGGGVLDYELVLVDGTFEDISGGGLPGPSGDDASLVIPIGFAFPFYDQVVTELRMSTNGYLTTGLDGEVFNNEPCGDEDPPNGALFVLWDDYNLGDGGETHYQTTGVAPNRTFIAQWTDVAEFGTGGLDHATFQVRLYECCGRIQFCYDEFDGTPSFPGDATAGLESPDATVSTCVPEELLQEGVCLEFQPLFAEPIDCRCRKLGFELEDDYFTPLANGQDLDTPPEFGQLITLHGYGSGVVSAAIFDSDSPGPSVGGPDPDLLVGLGNVVILQSVANPQQSVPGFFDVPNDCATGGVLEIGFLLPVEPVAVTLIDQCEPDFHTQVFLYDQNSRVRTYLVPGGWTTDLAAEGPPGFGVLDLQTLSPQPGAHGTRATVSSAPGFAADHVVRMEIHLGGSGAIDDLEFCITDPEGPE